ncbi:MAG TPA: hypothetical protein VF120_03145, partial [Ktedonobacterales bacterium]
MSAEVIAQASAQAEKRVPTAQAGSAFSRRNLRIAGVLALGSLLLFVALQRRAHLPTFGSTSHAYFTAQATAFLHLHWNIAYPGDSLDLLRLQGKWYSIYGAFPAVLQMPFVAVLGSHFSDTFFFTALSAINVGLVYLLFEQARESGFSKKTSRENILWAIFLYLGSTGLNLALGGGVWSEGHVAACACLLVCLILAFRRHYVWAAVALTCGFHSRSTLLFAFPLLFFLAWEDDLRENLVVPFARSLWSRRPEWALVPWRRLAGVAAVFAGCIALYLIRNWGMFGNPLESGYGIQLAQHYSFV